MSITQPLIWKGFGRFIVGQKTLSVMDWSNVSQCSRTNSWWQRWGMLRSMLSYLTRWRCAVTLWRMFSAFLSSSRSVFLWAPCWSVTAAICQHHRPLSLLLLSPTVTVWPSPKGWSACWRTCAPQSWQSWSGGGRWTTSTARSKVGAAPEKRITCLLWSKSPSNISHVSSLNRKSKLSLREYGESWHLADEKLLGHGDASSHFAQLQTRGRPPLQTSRSSAGGTSPLPAWVRWLTGTWWRMYWQHRLFQDLEAFVQSSGEAGVVVATFGSMITNLTSERAEVIAAAFGRLPQKVACVTMAIFNLGCTDKTEEMIQISRAGLQTHCTYGLELGINTSGLPSY